MPICVIWTLRRQVLSFQDVSSVFDHFWNGDWAVPISALVARPFNESDLEDSGCLSYEHWYGSQPL